MLGKEFAELVNDGVSPIVTFTKGVEYQEGYFEPGMRGLLKSVRYCGGDVVIFKVDFSEFDDFNKQYETANYYDKNNNPCLTAREAGVYKLVDEYYADMEMEAYMQVEDANRIKTYEDYKKSGVDVGYVQWLEDKLAAKD